MKLCGEISEVEGFYYLCSENKGAICLLNCSNVYTELFKKPCFLTTQLLLTISANPLGILVANILVPSLVNQQSDISTAVSCVNFHV